MANLIKQYIILAQPSVW